MRSAPERNSPDALARTGAGDQDRFGTAITDKDNVGGGTPQARWAARNPKARWAHQALASALRRGLIDREPCEVCGAEQTDGHHDNYDMPMRVRWLCRLHHKAVHRGGDGGADGQA